MTSKRVPWSREARAARVAVLEARIIRTTSFTPVTIQAAADDSKKARRFEMVAYSGGELEVAEYPLPVVIDLDGMSFRSKQLPVYAGHHDGSNGSALVGHSDQHDASGGRLVMAGVMSAATHAKTEIIEAADDGYEWQASVGAMPERSSLEHVPPGKTVSVNGQQFTGPIIVARKSVLRHIAILPEGADNETSLSIAARSAKHGEAKMNEFEKWIEALFGGEVPTLTDAQTATLEAKFEAEKKTAKQIDGKAGDNGTTTPVPLVPKFDAGAVVLAHAKHTATIDAKVVGYTGKIEAAKLTEITIKAATKAAELKASALNEEWPATRLEVELIKAGSEAELEMVRAERPIAPAIHGSTRDATPQVIEAAFAISAGIQKPEDHYSADVLTAADKNYRGLGLQETILLAARSGGYTGRNSLTTGNMREVLQAAFSTHTLTTLLTSTGNKLLLDGFMAIPQSWRGVAEIRTVNDFKTMTAFRLNADLEYEELPPSGEIEHGTVSQESYTYSADTYAKMLVLTRTDLINDDLGAFNAIRARLGLGAAIKMNKVFWTVWLTARNGAAFWTSARGNLNTSNGLDTDGLNTCVQAFREMEGPDGNLMSLNPKYIAVPAALEATAKSLHVSTELRDTTASTVTLTANIHQGSFTPLVIPEMGNSGYTGYSATTWHMLADPKILASAVMCFLNGQQAPTIESADADFNTLGIQFRGYHDFGSAMTEYRASQENQA